MTPEEFAVRRRALAATVIATLVDLFTGLGSWRDADAAQFTATAVPVVHGAQRALADVTAAYIAARAQTALDRPVAPPGIPADDAVDLRTGINADQVYRRPFSTVHAALAEQRDLDDAVAAGATRLGQITELDLQQSHARAARAAMSGLPRSDRPHGWRRVLIGQLNCALCVVASTQRYSIAELNPIHPACDCTVDPLFDSGRQQVIDPQRLEQAHDAVEELTGTVDRGARAPDYRAVVLHGTRDHGELGPMLARPKDRFSRGPGRRPAAPRTER